jgi:hypothetical protein
MAIIWSCLSGKYMCIRNQHKMKKLQPSQFMLTSISIYQMSKSHDVTCEFQYIETATEQE